MPFNTALSGLRAAQGDLKITGNNIANTSTVGFKQSRAEFADVYAASVLGSGQMRLVVVCCWPTSPNNLTKVP